MALGGGSKLPRKKSHGVVPCAAKKTMNTQHQKLTAAKTTKAAVTARQPYRASGAGATPFAVAAGSRRYARAVDVDTTARRKTRVLRVR